MTHHEHEPLAGKRAAVMVGPLFEDAEAIYPYYRLQEAGATVGWIGIDGEETVTGKKGIELTIDQAAADLVPDDLDMLVIAGGYGPDKLRTDEGVEGAGPGPPCPGQADRLHLPRRLGADLGRDRRGPPRDLGSGNRRRPAKRGRRVGGLGGRRRRQPDLLAPSARSARVHEGADRRGRRGLGARGG